jgi:hypothetical protein
MSKVTFALYLKTRKTADGLYNLCIRRTENRKHSYPENLLQLKFNPKKRSESEWDKKRGEIINRPDAEYLNETCRARLRYYRENINSDFDNSDLVKFARKRMRILDGLLQFSKSKRVGTTVKHIELYVNRSKAVRFRDINYNWVEGYKAYLMTHIKSKTRKTV